MQMSCGVCNLEYDFILKQETAMKENDWLIKIMGFGQTKPEFHIPGMYAKTGNDSFSKTQWKFQQTQTEAVTVSMEDIAKPYIGIPRYLIEEIYKNYFP